jgi:hypothetical protein
LRAGAFTDARAGAFFAVLAATAVLLAPVVFVCAARLEAVCLEDPVFFTAGDLA